MNPEEFVSDLNVPPQLVGTPALLAPMLHQTSSQRALMLSSNVPQVMVVHGAETARIQTGFETKYGRYELDSSARDQDVQILEIVPKFKLDISKNQINYNPTITVVYVGCDDNLIGSFDVNTYTSLHNGFGYINKKMNQHNLSKGNFIDKNMKFQTAPNHDNGLYNLGVNAKVCYIPMWDTTDDAFVISKSLAKKLEHTVIETLTIDIHPDDIPLNLYGDYDDYKCFPDIGESVRQDGIILGFRTLGKSSFLSDLTQEALMRPDHNHDELHMAPVGAEIIDVEIFTNHKKYQELCTGIYSQMMTYQTQYHNYYATMIDIYEKYKKANYQVRPEFNALITQYKGLCYFRGGKGMLLMNKKEPVDFIQIRLTYAYTRKVSRGFKLTSRDGAKGVISSIWEDEDMPNGADLLIAGESPFNRLNLGQNTEQFITFFADTIQGTINSLNMSTDNAYEYILEAIHDVRPVYAKFIRERTSRQDLKEQFVQACKEDGLYFIIPPFTNSITPEMMSNIIKKYNLEQSSLVYNATHADGTKERIETKFKTIVGSKYIYLLGKIPVDQLSCIEFGYVNQFKTPTKPKAKSTKTQSLFKQTPIRFGEDECAILTMSVGSALTCRLMGLYSNSPVAINELQYELLTHPKPTTLKSIKMTTESIIKTCSNINIFKHQLAATGYYIKRIGEG